MTYREAMSLLRRAKPVRAHITIEIKAAYHGYATERWSVRIEPTRHLEPWADGCRGYAGEEYAEAESAYLVLMDAITAMQESKAQVDPTYLPRLLARATDRCKRRADWYARRSDARHAEEKADETLYNEAHLLQQRLRSLQNDLTQGF